MTAPRLTPAGRRYLAALAESGGELDHGIPPSRLPAYRPLIAGGLVVEEGHRARLTPAGWRAIGRRPPGSGGPPIFTAETKARRAAGQLAIRIDPELAARIRAAAASHAGGVSGWLADAAREALAQRGEP